jgi:7-cyano-7-deazaguanine synthase
MSSSALVLFSAGQDSTTCLAWALSRYERVETLGFDYGQRHAVELSLRLPLLSSLRDLNAQWQKRLGEDHLLDLTLLGKISDTALTRDSAIAMQSNGLPNTFVPGRNLLFITVAAALAYRRGIDVIVGGMCETDYSGYPDCRDESLRALETALQLGMATTLSLQTPLMWLNKAATWQLAQDLGGEPLVALIRTDTHTCYLGERGLLHDWGHGCGTCPACELRANGYREYAAGISTKDTGYRLSPG